ncbi:MAG: hypothetical protein AB7O62_17440 [Pirellulales bacterium]
MSAEPDKLKILFLCNYQTYGSNANTMLDYIDAFPQHSRHHVVPVSHLGELPEFISLDWFDVVVVHYSICVISDHYLGASTKRRLAAFQGLKVLIIQDEYRAIFDFVRTIDLIQFDVIFSCLPPEISKFVYPKHILPALRVEPCLTGYVPDNLLNLPSVPMHERWLDVFYRARKVPSWLGSAGLDKWKIIGLVQESFKAHGLRADLAFNETDRVYGDQWIDRLRYTRTVLGGESAISLFDFTGEAERRSRAYEDRHPDAEYGEVAAACFPGMDRNLDLAVISPRCFEAAALRTGMVLLEGRYSGVLEPWRHYLPLKHDGSNVDQIAKSILDDGLMDAMTERTYQEIVAGGTYSYRMFVAAFDTVCEEEFTGRRLQHGAVTAVGLKDRLEGLQRRRLTSTLRRTMFCTKPAGGMHRRDDGRPPLAHSRAAANRDRRASAPGGQSRSAAVLATDARVAVAAAAESQSSALLQRMTVHGPEIVVMKPWKKTRDLSFVVGRQATNLMIRGLRCMPHSVRSLSRRMLELGCLAASYVARNL